MSRTANLLGALSLVVTDRMREVTGTELTSSAALVTLQTMTEGGSIDELRRVLGLSHSGGVRVVKALVDAGLVERRTDPRDRRAVRVCLTERGQNAAAQIRAARLEALDALLGPLSEGERVEFTRLLERALGATVGDRDDARHMCRLCDPDVCGHPDSCPVTRSVDKTA